MCSTGREWADRRVPLRARSASVAVARAVVLSTGTITADSLSRAAAPSSCSRRPASPKSRPATSSTCSPRRTDRRAGNRRRRGADRTSIGVADGGRRAAAGARRCPGSTSTRRCCDCRPAAHGRARLAGLTPTAETCDAGVSVAERPTQRRGDDRSGIDRATTRPTRLRASEVLEAAYVDVLRRSFRVVHACRPRRSIRVGPAPIEAAIDLCALERRPPTWRPPPSAMTTPVARRRHHSPRRHRLARRLRPTGRAMSRRTARRRRSRRQRPLHRRAQRDTAALGRPAATTSQSCDALLDAGADIEASRGGRRRQRHTASADADRLSQTGTPPAACVRRGCRASTGRSSRSVLAVRAMATDDAVADGPARRVGADIDLDRLRRPHAARRGHSGSGWTPDLANGRCRRARSVRVRSRPGAGLRPRRRSARSCRSLTGRAAVPDQPRDARRPGAGVGAGAGGSSRSSPRSSSAAGYGAGRHAAARGRRRVRRASARPPTSCRRRCTTSPTTAAATSPCARSSRPRCAGRSSSTARRRRGRCGAPGRTSATSGPSAAATASSTRSTSRCSAATTRRRRRGDRPRLALLRARSACAR